MLELKYESKIIFKNYLWLKKYVLGCKRSVPSTVFYGDTNNSQNKSHFDQASWGMQAYTTP